MGLAHMSLNTDSGSAEQRTTQFDNFPSTIPPTEQDQNKQMFRQLWIALRTKQFDNALPPNSSLVRNEWAHPGNGKCSANRLLPRKEQELVS